DLLEAEADFLVLAIHRDHSDVDFLTDTQDLRGMLDLAPGQLGQVDEAVGAAEIDKCAEIGQARDATVADVASLQLGQQTVLLLRSTLLGRRALGQDEPIAAAIHLDDLEVERLTAHRAQLFFDLFLAPAAAQLDDLAERHEAAHAVDRDDQTTFVVVDHFAGDDFLVVLLGLQVTPADFGASAID